MSCQTIYRFRIHLQESQIHPSTTFQWILSHKQHLTYNDLMMKLQRWLKGRLSLHDYHVFLSNGIEDNRYHLNDDESLRNAFSSLKLQRLILHLQCKNKSSSTLVSQTYYNTAPLIKPKVTRWTHHRDNCIYTKQQRKDSGIDLDTSLYLCSPGTTPKEDGCQSNDDRYSSLDKTFYPRSFNNDEEIDVPSATYSAHSSPSTVASSSPPSPMVFSSSDITPTLTDNKPPSSSWPPIHHSSLRSRLQATSPPPVYFCNQLIGEGNMCGQTFQRPYDLARHQSIHLKNRPFVYCQQCNKRFTRVDALRRHERVQGHFPSQKSNQPKKPHCYHPNRHHYQPSSSYRL